MERYYSGGKPMSELIHARASKKVLNFFRIWVLGIWLYIIAFDPLGNLVDLPPSALTLKGFPLRLMPETIKPYLLSAPFLYGLKFSIIFSLVGRIFGVFPRISGVACVILITLHQQFVRGFGHINHGEFALLFSLYALVIADVAGSLLSERETGFRGETVNHNGIPIIAAMFIFCFTFSFCFFRALMVVFILFFIF